MSVAWLATHFHLPFRSIQVSVKRREFRNFLPSAVVPLSVATPVTTAVRGPGIRTDIPRTFADLYSFLSRRTSRSNVDFEPTLPVDEVATKSSASKSLIVSTSLFTIAFCHLFSRALTAEVGSSSQ